MSVSFIIYIGEALLTRESWVSVPAYAYLTDSDRMWGRFIGENENTHCDSTPTDSYLQK